VQDISNREVTSFLRKSGVTTPGYQVLLALKSLKQRAAADNEALASRSLQIGDVIVKLTYFIGRNHVTIDVQSVPFEDWMYYEFWYTDKRAFDKEKTQHSNSIKADNDAKVIAAVNSLSGKTLRDREKAIMIANLRKQCKKLPEEVTKRWNEQTKRAGLMPEGGMWAMSLKQVKVLKAWVDARIESMNAPKSAVAESVVAILLEDDPPEEEEETVPSLSPAELVKGALGIGYKDEDFIFEEHQSRFGHWGTGHWTTCVKWRKVLRMGQPIYLGTIRQVARPYNDQYSPVPHEGEWYIDSVPTVTRERNPRGVRWKLWAPQRWTTRGGYGAVRFKHIPKTFPQGRYFSTRAHAAGYLASLVIPHRHLKTVESRGF
jgi:hypothetical protein